MLIGVMASLMPVDRKRLRVSEILELWQDLNKEMEGKEISLPSISFIFEKIKRISQSHGKRVKRLMVTTSLVSIISVLILVFCHL